MRHIVFISALALLASCSPVSEPALRPNAGSFRGEGTRGENGPAQGARTTVARASSPESSVAHPPGPLNAPVASRRSSEVARITRVASGGVEFVGVAFDSGSQRLLVADQSGGPGAQFPDAAAVGRARGALAAVNAGFFTPTGEPLGRVVASGRTIGAWNRSSSLGSGVWYEDALGKSWICRRGLVERSGGVSPSELIQAGPLLVENGRTVAGLDAVKSAIRTVVCWDGGTRWWIGQASTCTLARLGAAIATCQPAGWPVRHALNLDGGRSADLWISAALAGGPVVKRLPWNRPVRNFLILVPR